jgi:hypothetical protein
MPNPLDDSDDSDDTLHVEVEDERLRRPLKRDQP